MGTLSEMNEMNVSRKGFVRGAAMAGVAASLGMASVSAPAKARAAEGGAATGVRSWEIKPEPIADDQIAEVIDCDICVVGAGVSGVCCAQSAAEEGAKVVVLEKTEKPQGRGLDIGSIGNSFQKENPDIAQYIDATEAERIYYEFSHSNVNRLLFRHWAQHSGEAFDHLAGYLKETYGLEPALSATALPSSYDARDYYREMPTCQSFGTGWYDADGLWLMDGVVQKTAKWAQDLGAEFRFNTPAVQLVTDDGGAVAGVIGQAEDGSYVKVNAGKGVILCTGDISGNAEMLNDWCKLATRVPMSVYTPVGANTGDGIAMGMWVGADVQHGPAAPMIHPMGLGGPFGQSGDSLGFLCVNREGARFTVEVNNTPGMANALFNQPGGEGWTIFDSDYRAKILKMRPANTGVDGTPIVDDNSQSEIDAAVSANDGLCYRSDTIEGLAEQVGMDPEAFRATVERWNELCALGEDLDMSLDPSLLTPLDTPPYYASYIPQAILVIIFGLNCDAHSRVCDADDNPIPGLYAVGNVQGNFFSLDYPLVCAGISHGRCVTFGYTLPKAILAGELL